MESPTRLYKARFTGDACFTGATFTGNAMFDEATADVGTLSFDHVAESAGSAVLGIESMHLLHGAQVLPDGEPFTGWDHRSTSGAADK